MNKTENLEARPKYMLMKSLLLVNHVIMTVGGFKIFIVDSNIGLTETEAIFLMKSMESRQMLSCLP